MPASSWLLNENLVKLNCALETVKGGGLSPRPRKVDDLAIFAAMQRAMQRLGPSELTLEAIADEAGLTASALVQRFGSKRGLMIALARHAAEGSRDLDTDVRRGARS